MQCNFLNLSFDLFRTTLYYNYIISEHIENITKSLEVAI